LIKLANQHPRVNILQPGAGVGGALHSRRPLVHSCP
jgi:UDP-N-acetyl-D-mannosaminuronate dehydrogenase